VPELEVPVLNTNNPLTPDFPAFPVVNNNAPLDVSLPTPVVNDI
jgi:hypothetical protein